MVSLYIIMRISIEVTDHTLYIMSCMNITLKFNYARGKVRESCGKRKTTAIYDK